jgi:hypothetical protein
MGEEGENTLGKTFTESFGSGSDRMSRSLAAAPLGERERRRKKEKEEEDGTRLNQDRRQSASLICALLCYKDVGALQSTWHDPPGLAGSLRHHHRWCPSMHIGHQDG